MARLRSLTTTFSHASAELKTSRSSALSSIKFAVFDRSLWHATQYVATSSRTGVAGEAAAAAGACTAAAALSRTGRDEPEAAAAAHRMQRHTVKRLAPRMRISTVISPLVENRPIP